MPRMRSEFLISRPGPKVKLLSTLQLGLDFRGPIRDFNKQTRAICEPNKWVSVVYTTDDSGVNYAKSVQMFKPFHHVKTKTGVIK